MILAADKEDLDQTAHESMILAADKEDLDQTAHAQSDLDLRCPRMP